ncbi:glycoside hydrolase family 127 protein [Glycomyces luteolus]|uniref:Glycoside hydrolase family 127 protein n=1 Tax=Glycomyces luteolus TaxID=2670330 RepID=A0A9X3PCP1_9ACTN|nr:beta-L-arabinofuranosidase domain-containing protein [Glycomyces luteolus]MDA1361103.1 glycoside hydrolase family 127 protein [Glycomyces luteolus]
MSISASRAGGVGLAVAASLAMIVSGLAPAAAAAEEPSFEDAKVLDLRFDGSLADTSANAAAVTMQKGTEAYAEGLDGGQAFRFDGSSAIRLGTASYLQPQDLTVSFWYKPTAAMTGEQVFAWSKDAYNADGWYLTSESASSPLVLSIGPAGSQPYKVAVDTARADFFPVGEWTHVVASYDRATKAVAFYRNGIRQTSTVKFPVSGTATGVLGSESTTVKTLGYNGPRYNGSHLMGLLDDYALYNAAASVDDVVALTRVHDPDFDPAAVAQADLDAVGLAPTASYDFAVPLEGASGTSISWASSDSAVIRIDGGLADVTAPESGSSTVTLTATGTYGGGTATREFTVTVEPIDEEAAMHLLEAGLENVAVEDPYLRNANGKTIDYLLELDSEKFLYSFYTTAGLTPTTSSGYGGWERSSGTRFQGHFFGHYISALSQAYATTEDEATRDLLLTELTEAVDGLARSQDAYAAAHPSNAGYVAPFATSVLPSGGDGLLVPFYNLHKVLAGLLDAYEYGPEEVSAEALAVASDFGTWTRNYAASLSNPAVILNTEYGGMNEALYELYSITENPAHKRAAEYFDEVTLFQQLAAGQDVLNGKHANTTIPKLVGALKRYTVFTENPHLYATLTDTEKSSLEMYRTAAENFWQIVVDDHTYANGGNSQSEHFHGADTLYQYANNGVTSGYGENSTSEGCNEYNMLKLSEALFEVTKDVKYADFYESTFINTILASQNPETGMVTYFQPQTAGYAKVFGTKFDQFWCDHGTGVEGFTKLGTAFYFRDEASVYVNQFRSSELRYADRNLLLTQVADVPRDDTVRLSVAGLDGSAVAEGTTIRLRVPNWVAGTPSLTVNGERLEVAAVDGYVSFEVAAGDEIVYTLPAEVRVSDTTENANWVAFTYGPVLLAAELSRENVGASYTAGVLVQMGVADPSLTGNVVVDDAEQWKAGIAQNLVRIEDGVNGNGLDTMRFKLHGVDPDAAALTFEPYYSLYDARYATYVTLVEPDSAEAQALILDGKEQLRQDETTIDALTSFDNNNSEADKNYAFNRSSVGVYRGEPFRHAEKAADAWFQYDMIVDPALEANYLGVRYYGGDSGRTFDVYVNDVLLKHETVTNAQGATSWYLQYDEIPRAVLDGIEAADSWKRDQNGDYVLDEAGHRIPVVTVRFQGTGASLVGGVYGVYTTASDHYDTDAALASLSFDGGAIAPAFDPEVREYTVTVPADATETVLHVSPGTPSGLVYLGDILIDDTLPRTVAVGADTTDIVLTAYAQDHTTDLVYTVHIVHAPPVSAEITAAPRCVAGKVQLVTKVTNSSGEPVEVVVATPYGDKTIASLAAGASASQAFATRAASVAAGSVSATVGLAGGTATVEVGASYGAYTCG